MSKYVSPTAHFSIQWCIPTGKRLSQVSKNIKLTTYKGKQLKWRCHKDATIPKVELWFQLQHCYADFEVVCIFEAIGTGGIPVFSDDTAIRKLLWS